jgi:hypothetical protein
MRRPNPILAIVALLAFLVSGRPSSFELPAAPADLQIKWPTRSIRIALSTSLTAPSPAIKSDSDVEGAVRRALNSWALAANVTFVEVASQLQSVSPVNAGDGVSLITVAATEENLALFSNGNTTARTRVFYDPNTGDINEADIVINPFPYSADASLQFSTDGTAGTYDLESTLAHELGHFLGLNHSRVIGATMQATQALNGTFGLPATTERTLSEADQAAVRSLYETTDKLGAIEGRIQNSIDGNLVPVASGHVWIEDLESGRVIAGSLTNAAGRFSLSSVPVGNYRALVEYVDSAPGDSGASTAASTWTTMELPTTVDRRSSLRQRAFRSVEIASRLHLTADKPASLNYVLVPPQNSLPALHPRFIGINGELSTVPVPAVAGKKLTISVAGEGLDLVPGSGLVFNSPFITADQASLGLPQLRGSTLVISFDVTVAANAPPGDYSVRLQANSGEVAYLVGSIKVNPAK